MKKVKKIVEFVFDHILEINCLVLIVISFWPVIFPAIASGMDQAGCGGLIGISMSFYPFRDMGKTSLFGINSTIYLAVVLLIGFISVVAFHDYDPSMTLTNWERVLATYLGFFIVYAGIYVGKSMAGKE